MPNKYIYCILPSNMVRVKIYDYSHAYIYTIDTTADCIGENC